MNSLELVLDPDVDVVSVEPLMVGAVEFSVLVIRENVASTQQSIVKNLKSQEKG